MKRYYSFLIMLLLFCGNMKAEVPVGVWVSDGLQELEFTDVTLDGTHYILYNPASRMFFASGNEWSTRTSVATSGYEVWFTGTEESGNPAEPRIAPEGSYFFNDDVQHPDRMLGAKDLFTDGDGATWVDRDPTKAEQTDFYWSVTKVGDCYRIQNKSFAAKEGNEGKFLGWKNTANDNRLYMITPEEGSVDWKFVTVDSYNNFVSSDSYADYSACVNVVNSAKADGVYYRIDGNNAEVIANTNKYSGTVNIPASISIDNVLYNVTTIGFGAFAGCSGLTSIVIPNGVTTIGNEAFHSCSGLTSIEIPNSVTSIRSNAFCWCSSLTSIEIPNSVTSIGSDAFSGCSGLTSIEIPSSITSIEQGTFWHCSGLTSIDIPSCVTSIGSLAFSGCSGLTSIVIPSSVTSIGDGAFSGCTGLTSIEIPNGVTSIGSDAFSGCSGLTSIEIPSSVTSIDDGAFSGCSGLTSIVIPNGVTSIGTSMFYGCSGLTSITVEAGNTVYDSRNNCNAIIETSSNTLVVGCKNTIIPSSVTTIGLAAFAGCNGLTSIVIPNGVTTIGNEAFHSCSGLTSIEIPNSVTSIRSNAFCWCSSLTSIEIPNSVTSIGSDAFSGCSGLTSIEIPSSITSIEQGTFWRCSGLTSINIPNSVTSIGSLAFTYCSGLTSIVIPSSVTSIGDGAFSGCDILQYLTVGMTNIGSWFSGYTNLTTVTLTDGVKSIDDGAFRNCSGLISVVIPSGVTSIGDYAFQNCSGLTSIDIPSSVTSIGDYAFQNCSGLTSITIPNSVMTIGEGAFSACYGLTSIEIPNSVTSIGDAAFAVCQGLTSIVIPNSVTTIGNYAFGWCTSLTSVTVGHSTPISINSGCIYNCTNATLYVPAGSKAAYEAADYWKEFKEIVENRPHVTIAMGSSGISTYSNSSDLDFTNVDDVKAYIASGYSPSTGELTLTRVYKVPAGEGLLLKGVNGSFEVPCAEVDNIYANMLVGVPTATTVSPTEGSYTNFILANDAVNGIGFYPLSKTGAIAAGKAYLQLPGSAFAASRSLRMVFEDEEEETTGIKDLNEKGAMSARPKDACYQGDARNEKFFDLQGRRIAKPTKPGLYIKDGKKMYVK